jgi:hypothetical protein
LLAVEVAAIPGLVAICLAVLVAENTQEQQVLLQGRVTTAALVQPEAPTAAAVAVAREPRALKAIFPEQVLVALV